MMGLSFLCKRKILARLKLKTTFGLTCTVTKISWLFQFTFQDKNSETRWIYCLQLTKTSPIMCTSKILTNLCFTKQKMKTKNTFAKVVHSALVAKMYWQSIEKLVRALMVHNRVKGTIKFKNYFKQIAVPFKIYADFEWDLERVESYEGSYSKRYQDDIPCSFSYKLGCVDDKLTKPIVVFRGENPAYEFIKAIFKEYLHCKKVINKHFYKNLIMSEEEE